MKCQNIEYWLYMFQAIDAGSRRFAGKSHAWRNTVVQILGRLVEEPPH